MGNFIVCWSNHRHWYRQYLRRQCDSDDVSEDTNDNDEVKLNNPN